jgi:hypothetical protein
VDDERGGDRLLRYRSRGGVAMFGAWCAFILALAAGVAWSAVTTGEPPWFFAIGFLGIPALGIWSMSIELTMDDRDLVFRSLLRRRSWRVRHLRSIRPGNDCMVFKFREGGAMLATRGRDTDWEALVTRILELNPTVEIRDSWW